MLYSKNCSPAQTQKERSEKKLVSQEKMFYSLPLGKMPTLKRLVDAAGFEGDLSASLLKHSIRAMSEATDWDLDTESRHVWGFIVRMHKLLKSVHEEALAAARRKEVRHA